MLLNERSNDNFGGRDLLFSTYGGNRGRDRALIKYRWIFGNTDKYGRTIRFDGFLFRCKAVQSILHELELHKRFKAFGLQS